MSRQEANLKILKKLEEHILNNPDTRFGQALRNTGIAVERQVRSGDFLMWANLFYVESEDTLAAMENMDAMFKE